MGGNIKGKPPPLETPADPQPGAQITTVQGGGAGKRVVVKGKGSTQAPTPSNKKEQKKTGGGRQRKEEPCCPQEEFERDGAKIMLPCELDLRCRALYRAEGRMNPVRIIDRRVPEGKSRDNPLDYEYYVHYIGYNRRMDDWVELHEMDFSEHETKAMWEEDGKVRGVKRKWEDLEVHDDHGDFDATALKEHEEFTKVKNVSRVELGRHEMDTWYFSPLPPEYHNCRNLYFCEYDLSIFKTRAQLMRHMKKCEMNHPPGDEIYRNGSVSMFELDGRKERTYCQNLCYLAKLFLDHKTLYYDVDLFLFYVLCECDERGAHIVGYFSKEKCSEEGYNLACILTLPSYQRKGYGKFLISFSYELSKIEGRVGTPERPLSDLGLVSYRSYWTRILLTLIKEADGPLSIKDMSDTTAIRTADIVDTLQHLGMIEYANGQHVLFADPEAVDAALKKAGSLGVPVDPRKIIWTPFTADKDGLVPAAQRQQ
ncbi:unnamed protein product [Pedinophyceae sp. YPF-701]|nr:unnamed protein product [Pedinophyceae sp. YPF-701]